MNVCACARVCVHVHAGVHVWARTRPNLILCTLQVRVLELETQLQKEREHLGELRKKHYELAGVAEGWGEEEEGKACWNQHFSTTYPG